MSFFKTLCLSASLASLASPLMAADSFDRVGGHHIAVWRPANGTWHVYNRTTGAVRSQQWGQVGDVPVPADYDGDGTTDFAVWRPSNGTWYVLNSKTGSTSSWQWGQLGDVPAPGIYRTNYTELAVWRPSNGTWYVLNTRANTYVAHRWGISGDVPVPGSYATGGSFLLFPIPAYGIWRPSEANWYIHDVYGNAGRAPVQWGQRGDIPVPADYNDDGVTDFAIWRPSTATWWVLKSNFYTAPNGGTSFAQQWGQAGDVPIAADYDADGKADYTVWRPSNGTWYIIHSSTHTWFGWQWGLQGDVPVRYYVAPPPQVVK